MIFTTVLCYFRIDISADINDMVKKGWTFVSITPDTQNGGNRTDFILLFSKNAAVVA